MPEAVTLVANCPVPWIYEHRHAVAELYAGRFDRFALGVGSGPDWPDLDPDFEHVAGPPRPTPDAWEPARACPCADPMEPEVWSGELGRAFHPVDVHAKHLRMAAAGRAAMKRGWPIMLFADWDAILGRHWDADRARDRLAFVDAVAPPISSTPRSIPPEVWGWASHDSGFPSFDRAATALDPARLRRHWAAYAGPDGPPAGPGAVPMFSGFADVLLADAFAWHRFAVAAERMPRVWHEAATPTALLHASDRIGRLDCRLAGERYDGRVARQLVDALDSVDVAHPIKFGHLAGIPEACRPRA